MIDIRDAGKGVEVVKCLISDHFLLFFWSCSSALPPLLLIKPAAAKSLLFNFTLKFIGFSIEVRKLLLLFSIFSFTLFLKIRISGRKCNAA